MMNTKKFTQGTLSPDKLRFPEKYVGNGDITFRSSYERGFIFWADSNSNIHKWSSESVPILYHDPISRESNGDPIVRRYFPDFHIHYIDTAGALMQALIEIKPYFEAIAAITGKVEFTEKTSDKNKKHMIETMLMNRAKWNAARDYCDRCQDPTKWVVLTEKDMIASGMMNFVPNRGLLS